MTGPAAGRRSRRRVQARVRACGLARDARIYLAATAFCIFFACVYEALSHEVYSPAMIFMFVAPLVMGAVPAFAISRLARLGAPVARRIEGATVARKLWGSAVMALTLGVCFCGVLEIYGTTSPYVSVYWVAAIVLATTAVIAIVRGR